MNIKKVLLLALLATAVSTKVFAGFGIGARGYVDVNSGATWGIGATMGFGEMQGRPFILDVLIGFRGIGLDIKPQFDWHILPWNLGIVQLYLGIGVGTIFGFNTDEDWRNPFSFVLAGRIPLGVKVFLSTVEIFLEAAPQLGWINHSYNYMSGSEKKRAARNDFYWSIGISTGFRVWW